jgi:hypothetical protein
MNQGNLEILKHVQELLQKNILVSGDAPLEEEEDTLRPNSFSEKFKKFGGVFKLFRKTNSIEADSSYDDSNKKLQNTSVPLQEKSKIEIAEVDHGDLLKIKKYFWEV